MMSNIRFKVDACHKSVKHACIASHFINYLTIYLKKLFMNPFRRKYPWVLTTVILFIGYWVSCTKKDQVLIVGAPSDNSTVLQSIKVTTPPAIDGSIDAMWGKQSQTSI